MAETTARVLALLNLLQTHRQWAGPQLAERLGVTERTLRRDIERLRELGYAIKATRGSAGGYRLGQGAQLPPLLLTDEEAVTMAIGLRLAANQGLIDGEQSSLSALAKFEQVLPPALRARVNALASILQTGLPSGVPVSQELLGQLALACRDRERVRFAYTTAGGVAGRRVVEPHSVVAGANNWFLVCWDLDRDDWRTFRIDRIEGFFGTRVHFEPRELPAEDAAEFLAAAVSSLLSTGHSAEAVLAMPYDAMRERFGPWSEGAVPIDAGHTSWPLVGSALEMLVSALAWIPARVDYELRGSDEFLAVAAETADRMSRATAPRP